MPQLDITEHAGKQRRLMRGKRGVVRPTTATLYGSFSFLQQLQEQQQQ